MTVRNYRAMPYRLNPLCASLSLVLALSACAVGPDFKTPDLPLSNATHPFTASALPVQTAQAASVGGQAQRFVVGGEIPAMWWSLYHSQALDQLIQLALQNNAGLAGAQAALRQAQEAYRAEVGATLYPSLNAQLGAQRERASGAELGLPQSSVFNLYNASVNASYTLDVFGANRRELESLQAGVDYQQFELQAAYLSLSANVVTAAIQEASLRAQLQATREVLAAQTDQLKVIEKQYAYGAIAYSTVLSERNQVAVTSATVPVLDKALAITRHQLAVYIGRTPSESEAPRIELKDLELPQTLPVSLPSSLVAQRPDIRASAALLHAASAQVGVATANLYPQINLSASYGSMATRTSNFFSGANSVWSLAGGLTQPLFNAGSLNAKRRAALAAYDQALAQYKETVLEAFASVGNALRALEFDAQTLQAQTQAEAAARESMDLSSRQYQLGALDYLSLLDAQRTYQQARVNLVQAQAARYADTAALFQALGGGWSHTTVDAKSATVAATLQ